MGELLTFRLIPAQFFHFLLYIYEINIIISDITNIHIKALH